MRRARPVRVQAERRRVRPRCARASSQRSLVLAVGGVRRPHQRDHVEAAGAAPLQRVEPAPRPRRRSGCSRWQETIATGAARHTVAHVRDLRTLFAVRASRSRRSSTRMRARIRHRGPDQGSTDAFGAVRARPPAAPGASTRSSATSRSRTRPATSSPSSTASSTTSRSCARSSQRAATRCAAAATRRSSRTSTRSTGRASSSGSTACSRSRSGTPPRRRLVLARDRLGKKPLVWTRLADGTIAFASELKALPRAARLPRRARPAPRSTPTSRCSTSRARARGCAACSGSSRARCSSSKATRVTTERYWEPATDRRDGDRRRVARARAREVDRRRAQAARRPTCRSARCSPAASTRRSSSR